MKIIRAVIFTALLPIIAVGGAALGLATLLGRGIDYLVRKPAAR